MGRIQGKTSHTWLPPALFLMMASLAGSKRWIHHFPKATADGLFYPAVLGSGVTLGSWMASPKEKGKRICLSFLGLGGVFVITPSIAKLLIGKQDLNHVASMRFVALQGVLFGGVEVVCLTPQQTPPPRGRHREIHESKTLGCLTVEEMNRNPHFIRGFDKMVKGPWIEKKLRDVCAEKAHFVDSVITDNNYELLDLNLLLQEREAHLPKVMLVNNKMHYSVVVYEPSENKIYRFNSLSTETNFLEARVIAAMKEVFVEVEEVVSNKKTPQKEQDGWSCAFFDWYFLEHFLAGSSMEDIDAAPLLQESLARRLATYYEDLRRELVEIPADYQFFYQMSLEDKDVIGLKNLMQVACRKGWEDREDSRQKITAKTQIECILIRLWILQEGDPDTFRKLVQAMENFTDSQRRFLDLALSGMEWQREAATKLLYSTYYEIKGHPISPD
ncbi:MAG: hypothetical protein KDK64_04215 [Chlamydiia bacterium]|nr:hypothetical protein [Chlamydiia bacterium]